MLHELMISRSDNIKDKRILLSNLRETGSSNIPQSDSEGGTQKLFNIMMIGQGLMI
jgi:hypothetical protein